MQIITTCVCGQSYYADDSQIGMSMQCSTCQQVFVIAKTGNGNATAEPPQSSITPGSSLSDAGYMGNRYDLPSSDISSTPQATPLQPLMDQPNPIPVDSNPEPSSLFPNSSSVTTQPGVQPSMNRGMPNIPPQRSPKLFVGIAAVLAILVIGLIGYLLSGSSSGEAKLSLNYLPQKVGQVFFCNLENILKQQDSDEWLKDDFPIRQHFGYLQRLVDLELDELESVTVGYALPDEPLPHATFDIRSGRLLNLQLGHFSQFLSVIRTREPYDQSKMLELGIAPKVVEKEVNGKSFYQLSNNTLYAYAFPEPNVILYGSVDQLRDALGGSAAASDPMYSQIRPSDQIVLLNFYGVDRGTGATKAGMAMGVDDRTTARIWAEYRNVDMANRAANMQVQINERFRKLPTAERLRRNQPDIPGNPFEIADVTVTGRIVTMELSGVRSAMTRGTRTQALLGMLRPFAGSDFPIRRPKTQNAAAKQKPGTETKKAVKRPPVNRFNRPPLSKKTLTSLPTYQPAKGNRINLLEMINLKKDIVKGQWSFQDQKLVNQSSIGRPRFQAPYQPPSEYDLIVEFRQSRPRGKVSLIFPGADRSLSCILSDTDVHQFALNPVKKNPTQIRLEDLIRANVIHTVVIQKRAQLVRAVFDGYVLFEFSGKPTEMYEDPRTLIRNRKLPGFACETPTQISKFELVEVKGTGSFAD